MDGCSVPKSKADFIARYRMGEFGNRLRTWNSRRAIEESCFSGLVCIRNRVAGGKFYYGIPSTDLRGEWKLAEPECQMYFSEAAPDHCLVLQGEVSVTDRGTLLVYSTTPGVSMRQALAQCVPEHAVGAAAIAIMRWAMDPSSYEDVDEILRSYDGAVIEFSTYSRKCGIIPHRNTIIWEVRGY